MLLAQITIVKKSISLYIDNMIDSLYDKQKYIYMTLIIIIIMTKNISDKEKKFL